MCARCGRRSLFTRDGRWIHAWNNRRSEHAGYHIPQIVMPHHCENNKKWRELKRKKIEMPENKFYNEVGGISWDSGANLLTAESLRAAATLPSNSEDRWKLERIASNAYVLIALGIDWGGGGMEQVSFTAGAVAGLRADGIVEVIHGWRSNEPHNHAKEAIEIARMYGRYRCTFLSHDFCGAGAVRESILRGARPSVPVERIVPIAYTAFTDQPMFLNIPHNAETGQREHFQLDKPRSLSFLCNAITLGFVKFFAYDDNPYNQSILNEMLALTEAKASNLAGRDVYRIVRDERKGADDFAQAVNYAVQTLWGMRGKYPDLAEAARYRVTEEEMRLAALFQQLKRNPGASFDARRV